MDLIEIKKEEFGKKESMIQHSCVAWFRMTFPDKHRLLFAIPNGGVRSPREGAMMRYEGALSGAPDLVLLHKRNGFGALLIEMKTPKVTGGKSRGGKSAGRQSPNQEAFQTDAEKYGYKYIVCHGIEEFVRGLCEYACINPEPYLEDIKENYETYSKAKL